MSSRTTVCILTAWLVVCAANGQSVAATVCQQTSQGATVSTPELAEAAKISQEVVSLFKRGKYDEALPLVKRVVELREASLGTEHQLVASALANLGAIQIERGKPGDAEAPLKRALGIYDR